MPPEANIYTPVEGMACSEGESQRITEPLPLGLSQNRQRRSEVDLIFGPRRARQPGT
jgi:hypothetical protein